MRWRLSIASMFIIEEGSRSLFKVWETTRDGLCCLCAIKPSKNSAQAGQVVRSTVKRERQVGLFPVHMRTTAVLFAQSRHQLRAADGVSAAAAFAKRSGAGAICGPSTKE